MTRLIVGVGLAVALGAALLVAQAPDDVERHIEAARVAAGTDHAGLFDRVCTEARAVAAPRGGGARRGNGAAPGRGDAARGGARRGGPPATPPRETWHADPVRVFDNVYYVGMTEFSAWAFSTPDGIIVVDAIFDYSVEDEVVEGLRSLGLDPADIKYVVVSHAHLDHAGGAKLLQDRFGARVLMGEADWDLLEQQNPSWKPRRDMVVTDGQQLTLGDLTMTFYITPGHTLGTISTVVRSVRDGERAYVAAAWGGTAFNFGPDRARLQAYADQALRFRTIVAEAGADVLFANHTDFDGSKRKLPELAARRPGGPHPYVIGADAVQRYLTVANECAQAALAGLP